MTHRVLIVYATNHGHARKIVERVADVLDAAGVAVSFEELRKDAGPPAHGPSPAGFDAVVVAGSLHSGHHQSQLVEWIRAHVNTLAGSPTTFISVSLSAADDTDEARDATRACVDKLIHDTGWTPGRVLYVAGALQYREYDLPTRVIMRLIARRHHQPTDVHQDVDYTDWPAVEAFARELAAEVSR